MFRSNSAFNQPIYIKVQEIQPAGDHPYRHVGGRNENVSIWRPCKTFGAHTLRRIGGQVLQPQYYQFDGTQLLQIPNDNLQLPAEIRKISIYYDALESKYWCVQTNVLENKVGDGTHYDPMRYDDSQPQYQDETHSVTSQSRDDTSDNHDVYNRDWRPLAFQYEEHTAYANILDMGHRTLNVSQEPASSWARALFPPNYLPFDQTSMNEFYIPSARYLKGPLELLVALLAHAQRPGDVAGELMHCIRGNSWQRPRHDHDHRRRYHQRGIIVSLYANDEKQVFNYEREDLLAA